MGGVVQVGLEITDDRAEHACGEQARPQRTVTILADGRQLSQGRSHGRGHPRQLPSNLLSNRLRPIWGGQSDRLSGVRGGTQRVRAHMRDACGLPGRSGGGHRCRITDLTSSDTTNEPATDLLRDIKFAAGKGACPGDRITRAAITRSLRFEQSQHPVCAIGCPRRDDSPVSFGQCLRRPHA